MKTNWQTKKLGDVCKITTGSSNTVDAVNDGEYAFFDRSKVIKKSNRFLFDTEALIIPGEGAEFLPRYYSGKFDLHQRAYALMDFNKDAYIKFVEYFLVFEHKYFERVAVGATAKSLRRRHFEDLEITLPSIDEQKRIVRKLDEAFGAINSVVEITEKNLQNSSELFEASLNLVFNEDKTWSEDKLSNIVDNTVNIDWSEHMGRDFLYIDLTSVDRRNSEINAFSKVNRENAPSRAKKIVKKGDVIFGTTRPTLKRIALINEKYHDQICSTGFCVLRASQEVINSKLIFYYLKSQKFMKNMERLQTGTSYPAVSDKDVRDQMIRFPSTKPAQEKVVERLDLLSNQLRKLQQLYNSKLVALKELKRSILDKAFTGEL